MDALYILKNSTFDNFEIQYSLRSLQTHIPFIRKVWVFGDKPTFLSCNKSIIEHVPHEYMASPLGFKSPVTNTFLITFLGSIIPGMDEEFLWFCDDFFLLKDFPPEEACKDRYYEDMSKVTTRGRRVTLAPHLNKRKSM
ncbi:hypothetical protein KIH39_15575 [Telmatocola sphagniphila]|uniref:Stealth protein CR2 conserved region 2 domain-containing protein n=1 Tax=Telmatocola sphagniphila TaxID=1123043 RepID=A0A8E6B242_9BACT|nr:hypothetical protein [Telmatocola sphagniphila]QVL30271.1 hypothetical protein KIH39_15575 [Telmatocola sphagniphila]